jgi:lipid A 3-O-deacylase
MRSWCAGIVFACVAAGFPTGAEAQVIGRPDAAHLSFGVGYFDIVQQDDPAVELHGELRSNWRLLSFLDPFMGVSGTTDGAIYGYAGLKTDLYLSDHLVLMPNVAVGAFAEGDGKDLGSTVEFRSGVELAWRFEDRSRLGLAFHHISNASIGDTNPGVEILSINYSLPIDFLR